MWNTPTLQGAPAVVREKLAAEKIPAATRDYLSSLITDLSPAPLAITLSAYGQSILNSQTGSVTQVIQITLTALA